MYPEYEYIIPQDKCYSEFHREFRKGLCDFIRDLPDTELKEIMRGNGLWPRVAIVPTNELDNLIDSETRFLAVLRAINNTKNN